MKISLGTSGNLILLPLPKHSFGNQGWLPLSQWPPLGTQSYANFPRTPLGNDLTPCSQCLPLGTSSCSHSHWFSLGNGSAPLVPMPVFGNQTQEPAINRGLRRRKGRSLLNSGPPHLQFTYFCSSALWVGASSSSRQSHTLKPLQRQALDTRPG